MPEPEDDVSPTQTGSARPATAETLPAPKDQDVALDRPPAIVTKLVTVERSAYVELGEHARGGLGRILLARDERTGRQVALKEMLRGDPELSTRFVKEALVTANLQHPAIVPVYEVGRWPSGEPFYAMKLVRGRTLAEAIRGAPDRTARLALLPHVIAVADALAYAHGESVIHRDLKPANVLVGDFGETVVIDWGLARRQGEELDSLGPAGHTLGDETLAGTVLGTPAYMPPEQARGEPVDARADVYAIGAILYHLLGGAPPYDASSSADDTLARVVSERPRALDELDGELPADLVAIVERAMARAPADRYATARELAEDLRRYVTGHLVSVHAYTLGERLWRWTRRHRTAVLVGAVALVALVVIGVLSLRRVLEARDAAEQARLRAEGAVAESLEERARLELLADRPHRALPLLAEAMARGRRGPVTRLLAALALAPVDGVIGVRPVAGESSAAYLASGDLVLGDRAGVVRWRPGDAAPTWQTAIVPAGAVRVVGDELLVPTADALVILGAADGKERGRLPLRVIALSVDATTRRFALRTDDGGAELWDLAKRERLTRLEVTTEEDGDQIELAPGGRLALLGRRDASRPQHLYDLTNGDEPESPCEKWDPCGNATFAGRYVLAQGDPQAGEEKSRGLVYDLETHARHRLLIDGALAQLALAGDAVAVGTLAGVVELHALADGALRWRAKLPADAYRLTFTPDATRLVVLDVEGGIHVLDAGTGVVVDRRQISGGIVTSLVLSHDGTQLVAAGSGALLHVVSLAAPAMRVLAPTAARVRSVIFAGDWLITGSQDGAVAAVDRGSGETVRRFEAHTESVLSLALTPTGELLSAGMDGLIVRWRLADGARLSRDDTGSGIVKLRVHDDWYVTGGMDGAVRRWGAGATVLGTLPRPLMDVHVSGDGRRVAAVDEDGHLAVWAATGGAPLREIAPEEPERAKELAVAVRLSQDGEWLAFGGWSSRNTLFSVGDPAKDLLLAETEAVKQSFVPAFSPDGRRLALPMNDRRARIFDATTGELEAVLEHGAWPLVTVFSPDGTLIVSGGLEPRLHVWDAAGGRLLATLPMPGTVYQVVFSADGASLAVTTSGPAMRWRIPRFDGDAAALARIARCRSPWRLRDARLVALHAEPETCRGFAR